MGTENTSSTSCLLTLALCFGKGWLQAVPIAELFCEEPAWHLSTGLGVERGTRIKDCPKAIAMGKKTLVQMSLILCKHPLEVTLENLLHNTRVS